MNTLIFKSETGIEIKEDPDYNKVLLIQKWLNFECSGLRIGSMQFLKAVNMAMEKALKEDLITELPLITMMGIQSPVILKGEIHEIEIKIKFDI